MPSSTFARPVGQRATLGGLALAGALGASLLLGAPDAATAAVMPNPTCPQAIAAVGFPISSDDVLAPVPPPVELTVTVEGTLPDGLHLFNDGRRAYFFGIPTTVQKATFALKAQIDDEGDSTGSGSECS